MPDLNSRVDPLSFPILGLLGAFACGPIAPQETDGGSTDGSGTDPTHGPATDSTTSPTSPTDPSGPTAPTTSGPPPECQTDSDCSDTYCGYCSEGMCRQSPECYCGYGIAERVDGKWRCQPPYQCYSDEDCGSGYACIGGGCTEALPIPLPGCAPPDGEGREWNLGNAPTAFVLADLDGDLDLDLAAGEPASGAIEIALNDGTGNFILAGAFGVGPEGSGDLALAAGDLDGDGDLDLAVARHEPAGVLRLLFNDGAVFTVGEERPTAPLPVQVFIADVNGDGAPDVLTLDEGDLNLGVQLGDGTGTFAAEQPGIIDKLEARVAVAELTFDAAADVLAPFPGGGAFTAWAGSNGPLLTPLRMFSAPEATSMTPLSGDLDLQGFPEVVLVHPQGPTGMVHVWSGLAPGTWSGGRRRFTTVRPLTGGVLAELGGLPGPDLISATGQADISVLLGDGAGGFACENLFNLQGSSAPALLAVGDVTGDGLPDIVAGGLGVTTIAVVSPLFF
jgi:hypothetical protein